MELCKRSLVPIDIACWFWLLVVVVLREESEGIVMPGIGDLVKAGMVVEVKSVRRSL